MFTLLEFGRFHRQYSPLGVLLLHWERVVLRFYFCRGIGRFVWTTFATYLALANLYTQIDRFSLSYEPPKLISTYSAYQAFI